MNGKQTYDILTSCVHQLLAVNVNHPLTLYIKNDYENNSHKIYMKNKRFNHSSASYKNQSNKYILFNKKVGENTGREGPRY